MTRIVAEGDVLRANLPILQHANTMKIDLPKDLPMDLPI